MVREGKMILIDKVKKAGWDHYEFDENDSALEKYFEIPEEHCEDFFDESGSNRYSVLIHLEGSTIKESVVFAALLRAHRPASYQF